MTDETKDTQPLLSDILNEMRGGFAALREEINALRIEMREGFARVDKELEIINHQIGIIAKQLSRITAEHEVFERRLTKLEHESGIQ